MLHIHYPDGHFYSFETLYEDTIVNAYCTDMFESNMLKYLIGSFTTCLIELLTLIEMSTKLGSICDTYTTQTGTFTVLRHYVRLPLIHS